MDSLKRLLWRGVGAWLLGCLAIPCLAQSVPRRPLTLEDRIQAQEAIERVYYGHRLGAKRAFVDDSR